jgi:uncharacterized repeat protein (TIGR03803 family)
MSRSFSTMVAPVVFAIFTCFLFAPEAGATNPTTLYNFTGGADGADPLGGVIQDASGTIYGETFEGGAAACTTRYKASKGCGTVYSWNPAGGLSVLASFNGPNGAHGNASLVKLGDTLYGLTEYGGASDDGVVFSVSTSGANYTILHQFVGADGAEPVAIVLGRNGILYGITTAGGARNEGTLFSLKPSGAYTMLHSFAAPAGAAPNSLIIANDGTLVGGTTDGGAVTEGCHKGCGTVFSEKPANGAFKILYSFPGSSKIGQYPHVGSIGPGPTIYASQLYAAFSLSNAGYTNLGTYNFYGVGDGPEGGPVYTPGGVLYGILSGAAGGGFGDLYSLQNGVFTFVIGWDGLSDGGRPIAQPTLTPFNTLIGTTTEYGDCNNCGTIWQYGPLPQ